MSNTRRFPISLWVIAFGLCSALQIFRGSIGDEIIFLTATAIIISSTTIFRKMKSPFELNDQDRGLEITGLFVWAALVFIPRHTFFEGAAIVLIGLFALPSFWGKVAFNRKPLPKREKNARLMWSVWAIVVCLWEFAANILGQLDNSHHAFPTISILVDPVLDSMVGKAGFVLSWVAIGFGLLRQGSKHK